MAEQQEIVNPASAEVNQDPKAEMEVEAAAAPKGETAEKREREQTTEEETEDDGGGESKKQKVVVGEEEKSEKGPVKLGPKEFVSSVAMFDYFTKFMHSWPTDLDVNKYEHMVLLDLIQKGHSEPDKKIGGGIKAFQVRTHPMWKSRCFFLVRDDDSSDDFSFRKCVDQILPLPENMKAPGSSGNGHGGGGRGGRRGGRGGGRGGGRFRR